MEVRKANVMFGKAGGNASCNSYTCRMSLPKTWVDRMGLNPERREVQIAFDGDRITIQQPEGSPIKQENPGFCVGMGTNVQKPRQYSLWFF